MTCRPGGKRLLQKAEGYVATVKSGQVTFRDGAMLGPTPGGVIRGPQAAAEFRRSRRLGRLRLQHGGDGLRQIVDVAVVHAGNVDPR